MPRPSDYDAVEIWVHTGEWQTSHTSAPFQLGASKVYRDQARAWFEYVQELEKENAAMKEMLVRQHRCGAQCCPPDCKRDHVCQHYEGL